MAITQRSVLPHAVSASSISAPDGPFAVFDLNATAAWMKKKPMTAYTNDCAV